MSVRSVEDDQEDHHSGKDGSRGTDDSQPFNEVPDGVELSVSGEMSYNYGSPGVYFDNDSGVFTMPSTTIPIPGPMGMAALVASGLVRRNRRR